MTTATKPRKPSKAKSSKGSSAPKQTKGFDVIEWIEFHCVFTQGEWTGQPFRLLPWQKRLILELFEIYPSGLRRRRWALWGVPKKNGKTELAAALALYFLIGDGEPSPLVVCAAASDGQADLVFGAATVMCRQSPTLSQITECYQKEILVPSIPGAKLKRVAAVAGTNDGQNIHAVICDELHEWTGAKGENVWNVLTNGTGARRQPMVLQITTAGYDEETVCFRQYDHCRKIEAGEIDNPRYHFYWIEAPEGADYKDPKVWAAANPSYGVTVHEDFYRDQMQVKPENIFRRYFLNQWTTAEQSWLPPNAWADCLDTSAEIPDGSAVWLGVDIATRQDTSAIVVLYPRADGTYVARAEVFTPPLRKNDPLDLELIETAILKLARRYRVRGIAFDPYNFERSAQALSDKGLLMIDFFQRTKRLERGSARLYEAITAARILHNGDPTFTAHVNAGAVKDTPDAWRLSKGKAKHKIDALMALMFAFATAEDNSGGSIYETRGVITI